MLQGKGDGFARRLGRLRVGIGGDAAQDDTGGGVAAGRKNDAAFPGRGRAVDGHAAGGRDKIGQIIGNEGADFDAQLAKDEALQRALLGLSL